MLEAPGHPSSRARSKPLVVAILSFALAFGFASSAGAHGPTIKITHSEMKPPLLNLFAGQTVHFENTVSMPGGHVVIDASGAIESPPLEKPGDGWHYTFEETGTYELRLKQHPKTTAKIVVVPKKD